MFITNCVKEKGHTATSDSNHHELYLPLKASYAKNYQTNTEECSYRPLHPNISDLSDLASENEEEISKRIEMLADAIILPNKKPKGEMKVEKPKDKSCQYSRQRKSSSRDKNVGMITFISETIPIPYLRVCVTDTAGDATMLDMITRSV
jgi:hypothetical protein